MKIGAHEPPHVSHQLPRWREVRELVRFRHLPRDPVARRLAAAYTVADLREIARHTTPRSVFDYVDGGAEDELTLARNTGAFRAARLLPDALVDVSAVDLSTKILGRRWALPFGFGPTGFTRMMHHHGECSIARVAAVTGVPYALATTGTSTIEQVRAAAPDADLWFQLYVTADHELNARLVDRARRAGCTVLVVTVDTSVGGARLRDDRNGLTIPPSLSTRTFANMALHPSWWLHKLTTPPITFASLTDTTRLTAEEIANAVFDPTLSSETFARIRAQWAGPLVVKGILSVDSALAAVRAGADAVVVSNHGGRQLDRAPATLEVLPAIRAALGPGATVLLDGGVRHGCDVAVAVAAGADGVLLGRAYLYALMAGGERGVRRLVELLTGQYRRCLQLLGVPVTANLSRRHVRLAGEPVAELPGPVRSGAPAPDGERPARSRHPA